MKCAEAREAILAADPRELDGTVESDLAGHLDECARCREWGDALLRGEAWLALALSRAVPELDLDLILDLAESEGSGSRRWAPRHGRLMPRSKPFRVGLPLAFAAGLAALALFRGPPSLPGPPFVPSQDHIGLEVEVPPDRSVALLATNDPTVTVLWIFPGSEES